MGCCGLRVEGSRKWSHPALAWRVSGCLPHLSGCRHTGPSLCTITPTFCRYLIPSGRIREQRNPAHSQHFLHPPAHHLCLGHIILPFQSSRPPLGHSTPSVWSMTWPRTLLRKQSRPYSFKPCQTSCLASFIPLPLVSWINTATQLTDARECSPQESSPLMQSRLEWWVEMTGLIGLMASFTVKYMK